MTFSITYLRDYAMNYGCLAESMETSANWADIPNLIKNVKEVFFSKCKAYGIERTMCTYRIPQIYDTGACVYFYFGFNYKGLKDPVHTYAEIEDAIRTEMLKSGGAISHHHGKKLIFLMK